MPKRSLQVSMKKIKLSKKCKEILRVTAIVLAALIIGLNVYSFNASRLAGNAVPMPFGIGVAVVLSGSMEPEISSGDLLIVTEREGYAVEDIVVYQDGRMAVTHRIISISGDEVITKGDANNAPDDPITMSQVKGKVLFAIPLLGYLVDMIKTPVGTIVILGAAVLLLERSFRAEVDNDKKKLEKIKAEIEALKQQQNSTDNNS